MEQIREDEGSESVLIRGTLVGRSIQLRDGNRNGILVGYSWPMDKIILMYLRNLQDSR